MKKVIITVCIALMAAMSTWAGKPVKVENLIREYKDQDGFEVVSFGRLGMHLIKSAAELSGDLDEEDRVAFKAFSGIRKLVIVNFEDAPAGPKAQFTAKLEKMFDGMELVMEMKDSGETVRIYGTDNGTSIEDCILYDADGSLIYAAGSIDLEHIGELMEMEQ